MGWEFGGKGNVKEGNEDRPRIEVRILKFRDKVMMKCFDSRYKKRQESSE